MLTPATRSLSQTERVLLYLLAGIVLGYGILVELRSAGLARRMGDLDVYLRSAWAARTGADIYSASSDNEWHYVYPPLYALLLMPLADPPPGQPSAGHVPYGLSVALFYALNMALLFWSAHLLAAALEAHSAGPGVRVQPRFCRRWWALRVWPILFCVPPAAQTSMRGQVNHIVLALLCLCLTRMLRGQRWRAGVFLALAACIKVIPLYLLVYPAWRRDFRMLGGCAVGLLAGLVLVPLAFLGPGRTLHQYERYAQVFFGPLLGVNEDRSRQAELLGINRTDSVGLRNALFNWSFLDPARRPRSFPPAITIAYGTLGGLMTLLVLLPGTVGRRPGPWFEATQFSALVLLMAILSPICHLHYLVFCLPLVACLLARQFEHRPTLRIEPGLLLILIGFTVANLVPSLPGLERLKDLCVNMLAALPVWSAGATALWRRSGIATVLALARPLRQAA